MFLIRSIRFRGATISFYGRILTLCTIVYKRLCIFLITMLHSNFVDCILWTLGPGPIIFPMGAVALGNICWPELWFGAGSSDRAFPKTDLAPCVFGDACTCACRKLGLVLVLFQLCLHVPHDNCGPLKRLLARPGYVELVPVVCILNRTVWKQFFRGPTGHQNESRNRKASWSQLPDRPQKKTMMIQRQREVHRLAEDRSRHQDAFAECDS